ncbi:protein RETICULATA-RELATED 1, chloroplastic-like [Prosopis cineraria]|uniref:protein RETICULATA-RELATED 1, chloroplastic-like n=1 Tax=Prosopis cineraria TaxID=364024 RepID=UPI00240F3AF5|nr:protein RETICULATA-RELATED 1, chloroplastic-like [Prosopis cineraria]
MAVCPSTINVSNIHNFSNTCASAGQYAFKLPLEIKNCGRLNITNLDQRSHMPSSLSIHSPDRRLGFSIRYIGSDAVTKTTTELDESTCDNGSQPLIDRDGGDGGGAGDGSGGTGGGGGGGNGNDGRDEDEEEFGPLLKFVEVMKVAEARGVKLPSDMTEAAKATGVREMFLLRYLELQGSVWPLGFLMKHCSMLRKRMLADPSFLFKVGTEIAIDSCCATFAEVQKRGKDFWAEFELYAADLLVGVVVDIALVGMLAPYARLGQSSVSRGLLGRIQHACAALPSSVFEAERPGCKFSVMQRIATYFIRYYYIFSSNQRTILFCECVDNNERVFFLLYTSTRIWVLCFAKGVLYGSVGFGCGLIGQGIANTIMNAKRRIKKSEEDIPVPPLVESAALWGVFLAVSSNTRYQIVNGLEGLVEASSVAKKLPLVAMIFTVCVRFGNNIYGGMQFVDWAKLSGVQ